MGRRGRENRRRYFRRAVAGHDGREVYPGETAELPVADVSEDDRELLGVGAVFCMTVGYYVWADGRRERFGRVVFRRLPGWTASALERARERARRITRFLRPE